jgi:hypothetical protein
VYHLQYLYGSHSAFRNTLCVIIGMEDGAWLNPNPDLPFYELFDFSDCEGSIDFETSEKLYNDFKDNYELAKEKLSNSYEFTSYETWLKIFELGKQRKSVVRFC